MDYMGYEFGYDTEGRAIVVDSNGNYVTHIPCHLSKQEVMQRLLTGTMIPFDGTNQGMQNISGVNGYPTIVAPREDWPMHEAWERRWYDNIDDTMTFEEFKEQWRQEHPGRQ